MQPHYIEFNGKHPKATKENRVYTDKPDNRWSSYGCSYSDEFLKLDIDDYDHKTGVPEEPIHNKPRSEAVIKLLNHLGIRDNGIKTENGVHLFFRTPKGLKHKNIAPWYCVIGVKCEWKFPESDDHIPLKINKTKRKFFKGSIDNTEVDELPFFLMPLQKSKEKPFDIHFPEGERMSTISIRDQRLAGALGRQDGLTVVEGDALSVIARGGVDVGAFDAMVSNLPYQAGTRILLDLVTMRAPAAMTVLVQSEVAERLAAAEGSKTRGLAGVWAQLDYDVRIVRRVSATCFWPRPQVGSSVVRLDRHERNAGLTDDERRMFRSLTKRAFSQRRKQLGRVFKYMVQSTARAEELSNEDWIALTKGLAETKGAMQNEDT